MEKKEKTQARIIGMIKGEMHIILRHIEILKLRKKKIKLPFKSCDTTTPKTLTSPH